MVHIFYDKPTSRETFVFTTFSAGPALRFCFDSPVSKFVATNRPCKRRRALSDIGDGNEGRKKRRLRLHLITSRLSSPFSQPATNIVNRGYKVPLYGLKVNALNAPGKNVLRKAAIMNRVRRRIDAVKDCIRLEEEQKKETLMLRELALPKPRCLEQHLPPSPLGLSNYDALDLEDELSEDDNDGGSAVYSDFSIMNPITATDGDNYDYLDTLDGITPEDLRDAPPPPPDTVEILER